MLHHSEWPDLIKTVDSSFWQGCRVGGYSSIAGGSVNLYRYYRNQCGIPWEDKNDVSQYPAILLLGIYPKETPSY